MPPDKGPQQGPEGIEAPAGELAQGEAPRGALPELHATPREAMLACICWIGAVMSRFAVIT